MKFFWGLVGVVVIVFGMSIWLKQEIPATLGILGFILAVAKIGYDLYEKEQEKKTKEEQSKERIETKVVFCSSESSQRLILTIYNPCTFSIPISHVSLECEFEPKSFTHFFFKTLLTNANQVARHGMGGINHSHREGYELPERKRVTFDLWQSNDFFSKLAKLPKESIQIQIHSHGGEIGRISGDEILNAVRISEKPSAKLDGSVQTPVC